jgi:ClpP class serine protease
LNTQHADYLGKLLTTCWNIDRLRGRTLLSGIAHALLKNERPSEDFCGDPLPKMQILGDIALIPLSGILCLDVPDWIKQYGINLTDADDIEEELEEALEDANVAMIVLDVDSPGGMSLAGDKLFEIIEAADKTKPVMAYCADGRDMASSAYEAAAAARLLYCGRYACGIGCVGSYLAYLDDTEFWSQMGITFELFKSGDVKGVGGGVPLNQAQKDFLQATVDQAGALFRKNVRKYRKMINPNDLQGQWFDGITAGTRSFVTGNAPDLQTAISKFRREIRKAA